MKRLLLIFPALITSLTMNAFHYRPEIDGDGGLFFVTGDNALSGVILLLGCVAIAFILYNIAGFINKDDEKEGVRKTIANILYMISFFAGFGAVIFAFAIWWIVLIIFILYCIGLAIYEKITSKKQNNVSSEKQLPERKETDPIEPKIEQKEKVNLLDIECSIENKIKEANSSTAQQSSIKCFNIGIITPQQRRATFGLIAYLGKRLFESNQEDADKIINNYAEVLQISKEEYDFILSWVPFNRFTGYFCEIENIRIDEYWNFVFKVWRELINMDTGKRKLLYYKLYKTMKKALYFTDEEVNTVLQGRDIHKYNR